MQHEASNHETGKLPYAAKSQKTDGGGKLHPSTFSFLLLTLFFASIVSCAGSEEADSILPPTCEMTQSCPPSLPTQGDYAFISCRQGNLPITYTPSGYLRFTADELQHRDTLTLIDLNQEAPQRELDTLLAAYPIVRMPSGDCLIDGRPVALQPSPQGELSLLCEGMLLRLKAMP